MLQALSLVALAGDPSPWRLPAAALDPLVKLLGDLVEGADLLRVLESPGMLRAACSCFVDALATHVAPVLHLAAAYSPHPYVCSAVASPPQGAHPQAPAAAPAAAAPCSMNRPCCPCLLPGCPHLAAQMWDDAVMALQPLRSFVNEACGLFPAYLAPFLRLATGLSIGAEAAEACYDYLSKRPPLVVEFPGPGQPCLQVCCMRTLLRVLCDCFSSVSCRCVRAAL
jgi:hypothetical protein